MALTGTFTCETGGGRFDLAGVRYMNGHDLLKLYITYQMFVSIDHDGSFSCETFRPDFKVQVAPDITYYVA